MFWYILGVVCLVLMIIGIIVHALNSMWDEGGLITALISGIILVTLLILVPIVTISDRQSVTVFKQQKEYIESHKVVDSIENAALANKKIELNEWLFNAQYSKEHYGMFTFLPDEVKELTPIK